MGSLNDEIKIEEYSGLVKAIAAKYSHLGLPFEDLLQEGMIGLLEAKERFDSSKGVLFSTYATFWVKKRILDSISKENLESGNSIAYNDALDNTATADLEEAASLDPAKENENGKETFAKIPDDFPQDEKSVLNLHFNKGKTLNQIAADMNISREKVRQLKQKGLRRMRANLPKENPR